MYISLDLETTGIDSTKDRIIEFGAIKFDLKGHTEKLSFLINPGVTLPQIITHITKITDNDLKDQPPIADKLEEIKNFIGDLPIIGHNIQFDTSFLKAAGIDLQNQEYDTFNLASILLPNLPSYSLEILSDVLDIQHREKHRALDDSIAAMELFIKLIQKFESLSPETIEEIKEIANKSNWKLKDLILSLSAKDFKESEKSIVKPFEIKEKFQKVADLIGKEEKALFEIIPPYNDLIPALLNSSPKDSYICLDYELFNDLAPSIPDDIAQLDIPKNYISPKRLSELKDKTFLEEYEATALIKFLIWVKNTKTGLLREVSLFGTEKTVIYQVNSDPELTNIAEEPFIQKAIQKDQNSPAICSFEYLMDQEDKKINNLIIVDFEKFTKSLFYKNSLHLSLDSLLYPLTSLKESNPENKTIESLIGKSSILFGLLGLIFDKYNNKDSYNPRTILNTEIESTKEWQDASSSLNNLISISQELGEILGPKTQGHLHKWKKKLIELKSIFEEPDLFKFLIFIEMDWNKNCTLHKMPISLKEAIYDTLENCENYKLIDECIDLNDKGKFTKTFYGLPEDLKIIKSTKEPLNLIINISKPEESPFQLITDLLTEKKGHIAMVFNSKKQIEFFTLKLGHLAQKLNINLISQLVGSIGKLEERFAKSPENSVLLITPAVWERFRYHELVHTLIIDKIPFDAPGNLYLSALSQSFKNPFIEFQVPHASMNIKKILNRLKTSDITTYVLDSRLYEKDYCEPILKLLTNLS